MADTRRRQLEQAGAWLRAQRERAGYATLAEFARALGVDQSMVSRYERGVSEVDDARAEQIAHVLELDVITARRGLGLWVPPEEAPGERLARLADARVGAVGVTWDWVAEHTGVDRKVIKYFRIGHPIGPQDEAAIEHAILWAAGSRHQVLDGDDPVAIPPTADVEHHYVPPHSRDLVRVTVQHPGGGELVYALPRERWEEMSDEDVDQVSREMVQMVRTVERQAQKTSDESDADGE